MAYENYIQVTGVIQEISSGSSCCTLQIALRTDQDTVNFIVNGDTQIIDNIRLRRGMRIAAFYDSSLPAPAIFPPRYQAELITVLRRDQNVMLQYFDENLMAEDQSLKLNLAMGTNVVSSNGQRYWCTPENAELLVYYTTTTFSIPPQTTPQKIVVMCGTE